MIASGQPEMAEKAVYKYVAIFNPVFNSVKGGGEKLILAIRNQLGADLVAGSVDWKVWGKEDPGHDSFVDLLWSKNLGFQHLASESSIPGWRRVKRNFVFRFAPRVMLLNRYELVIFYGDPAGIPCRLRSPKKMLYCNTPPRHLTDQKQDFLKKFPGLLRPVVDIFLRRDLRRYIRDIRSMDLVITNSENIRQRLYTYTGVNSLVIFPAVFIGRFRYLGQKDYYLSYARLDDWKRIRLIIEAFERMPEKKLIVASSGPLRNWLEKEIKDYPNITYIGQISDDRLAQWIGNCIAGIYIPVNEDAGMTPCELMAAGKPVIGIMEGGIMETIIDRKTGILIKSDPGIDDLINAVNWLTPAKALQMKEDCIRRSRQFGQNVFFKKMSAAIASLGRRKHSDTAEHVHL